MTRTCLICKAKHDDSGQQVRSPWQISIGFDEDNVVICRRCCDSGKRARIIEETKVNNPDGKWLDFTGIGAEEG